MTSEPAKSSTEWPSEDLETLGECPICHSSSRVQHYDDLEDWSFRSAPGKWTLWNCVGCKIDYLDPRPSVDSIGRAYEKYYTHDASEELEAPITSNKGMSWLEKIKKKIKIPLRNGYLSDTFGVDLQPNWSIGAPTFKAMPLRRLALDLEIRHLRSPPKIGAKLLDIGFGDGAFLQLANHLGYAAEGIDPDPRAVQQARQRGLVVHEGGFPKINLPSSSFQHVTLSHVIEHVHDPLSALQEVLRLLTPNGRLWLATPNMESPTLKIFGPHWRGLEAPRHLCLFSEHSLRAVLTLSGFREVSFERHPPCSEFFVEQSVAQQSGQLPYAKNLSQLTSGWKKTIHTLDRNYKKGKSKPDVLIATALR